MAQGIRPGQPQGNGPQPTRQAGLIGRLSPQQSLRKVKPALAEVLCTSVRSKPRGERPVPSRLQKFRPNSGAGAILCLDDRLEAQCGDDDREQASHIQQTQRANQQQPSSPSTGKPLPTVSNLKGGQAPQSRLPMPEKRVSIAPPPAKKDAVKVQLPGLLISRQPLKAKGRRVSKALPSLPPPTPSPCKASFAAPPNVTKNLFEDNRDKVLRGQASPTVSAPPMKDPSGSSEYSSGSSYDSAEQTWNMINNMMRAVGVEEVRKARESLIRPANAQLQQRSKATVDVPNSPTAYVTFPRMGRAGRGRDGGDGGDGWSSDGENSLSDSDRTAKTASVGSSTTYCSPAPFKVKDDLKSEESPWGFPGSGAGGTLPRIRPRNTALPVKRRASIASSVFSIVIQPTREGSYDRATGAQDALVVEDDMPGRIKGILQCTHDKTESAVCSRTWTQSSDTSSSSSSSNGAELHPDIVLTIDTLRGISVEDIQFF